jgi:hypothetical protein
MFSQQVINYARPASHFPCAAKQSGHFSPENHSQHIHIPKQYKLPIDNDQHRHHQIRLQPSQNNLKTNKINLK